MATHYSYQVKNGFHVIRTHVSNIKNVAILQPLCNTSHYGINGGFFHSPNGYSSAPTSCLSINWHKDQTSNTSSYNGTATDQKKRGTFITFFDTYTNKTLGVITRAKSITEIKNNLGTNLDYRNMIGGGSLALNLNDSDWKDLHQDDENWNVYGTLPLTQRTAMGLKVENGEHMAYLISSKDKSLKSLYNVRDTLKELGCIDGIFLDGNGSSQTQVYANNALIQDKGSDAAPGRYIYNAVTLINKT